MYLENIREGGDLYPLTFREGDQFPEIADDITDTVDYLTTRTEEEIEYLGEVVDYIENIALVVPEDKKPVLAEIQKKIKEIQAINGIS